MRTLVISDLHLGSRRPVDILRRPEPLDELCARLADIDRLVLLGDILEMRHGPAWEAMAAARPVLEAMGSALPAGSEIVLAAGNHDFPLVAQWLDRRRLEEAPEPLGEQTLSDPGESAIASQLAGWLDDGRHRVRVAYPGFWVREDVWATHGHYLDRLITIPTFERLAAGGMARVVGRLPEEPGSASAEDFEAALAPMYAWLEEIANGRAATAKAWTLLSGFPAGRDPDVVRAAAERLGVEHPVVLDPDFACWRAYDNPGWPARYLFAPGLSLVDVHHGDGAIRETELAIREQLGLDDRPGPGCPPDDADDLLVVPSPPREGNGSGPYAAGEAWAICDGRGELEVNGETLEVAGPGAVLLVSHPRHTEGVLDIRAGDGVEVLETVFLAGPPA
ncbi:MAG: metallophosphoesterase [Solirubrobacterales bacterium]